MYDPKQDGTAGGAVAQAVVNAIAAYTAVQQGTRADVLYSAQGQLAKAINDYIIEPAMQRYA